MSNEKEVLKVELERKVIRNRTDIAFREFENLIKQGWGLASGNSIRIEANGYVKVDVVRGIQEDVVVGDNKPVEDVPIETEKEGSDVVVKKASTRTKKVDTKEVDA